MEKNECAIVHDLLPLYIDGAVSTETKRFIETHLDKCPACREEMENMRAALPKMNKETRILNNPLKKLKNNLLFKRILTAVISVCAVLIILFCIILGMNRAVSAIPYNGSNYEIVEADGKLYLKHNGKGSLLYTLNGDPETGKFTLEASQTFWDKVIQPLYKDDDSLQYISTVEGHTEIDADDGTTLWKANPAQIKEYQEWSSEQDFG